MIGKSIKEGGHMYRFRINEREWILRFAINVDADDIEKNIIFQSIVKMGHEILHYNHGDSFILFDKDIGAIIFSIETIPSYILTVANIINEVDWFQIKNGIVSRKKDQY
ncbi:hypothetical protein U9M49_06865 [Cytobacillus sp. OWB-43]|uniref:hypothetical protein n=1 Tax=Cytobacillus sp. OWB-43 TaxID=3108468 RepID=UPI002AFEF711|nr:hypothetical protein [Cytobacillus sp. OWB-43]MEA1852806.1 hypothetical protein [Cytobacillus sp. OWB-43]